MQGNQTTWGEGERKWKKLKDNKERLVGYVTYSEQRQIN